MTRHENDLIGQQLASDRSWEQPELPQTLEALRNTYHNIRECKETLDNLLVRE